MKIKKPVRFILFILFIALIVSTCTNKFVSVASNAVGNKTYKVVIDPGHGGRDPGATGVSGSYEKDFTLSLAKEIARSLEKELEIEVHMTREGDTFLSSKERLRPKFANDLNADLYISIHGNTFADPIVAGTQSFYYHENSQSFAEILH